MVHHHCAANCPMSHSLAIGFQTDRLQFRAEGLKLDALRRATMRALCPCQCHSQSSIIADTPSECLFLTRERATCIMREGAFGRQRLAKRMLPAHRCIALKRVGAFDDLAALPPASRSQRPLHVSAESACCCAATRMRGTMSRSQCRLKRCHACSDNCRCSRLASCL